jgi:endonuclease/exonuclease/phosphatase family metal-dependent hydrolase
LIDSNQPDNLYTCAFYNLENLFDIYNDPKTLDDDFTAEGRKKWNKKRYDKKVKKMSSVIAQIGKGESGYAPAIIGLAEVENRKVVEDLTNSDDLKRFKYDIVHFDSSDERGIEVALLFRRSVFELLHAETFTLFLTDDEGKRDFTRDVLLVKGNLKGELVHIVVNHWPSRRRGTGETENKRIKAAKLVTDITNKIYNETKKARIIVMGDFNDNPTNNSIKQYLVNDEFHNPFESIFSNGKGTLTYDDQWLLFDQIIITRNFLNDSNLAFDTAKIFDEHFLEEWKGKRKGSPFRTYIGKWHQGGYSDHFPVFITLQHNPEQ